MEISTFGHAYTSAATKRHTEMVLPKRRGVDILHAQNPRQNKAQKIGQHIEQCCCRLHSQDFLIDTLPCIHFQQPRIRALEKTRRVCLEENTHDGIQERLLLVSSHRVRASSAWRQRHGHTGDAGTTPARFIPSSESQQRVASETWAHISHTLTHVENPLVVGAFPATAV